MLRVKSRLDTIEVRFYHKWCNPYEIEGISGVWVDGNRKCTVATVSLNGRAIGKGIAICNPIDNFNRSTGRKKALSDGLFSLSKQLRTAVWEAYEIEIGF